MGKSKKSKTFTALNYHHRFSVTLVHDHGRLVTTVRGRDAMAVWTNQEQNGHTVRTDNQGLGIRFHNSEIVDRTGF